MVIKKIYPELFHFMSVSLHGKKTCYDKVNEEVRELYKALVDKDRDAILSELADVENVLPYLNRMYGYFDNTNVIRNEVYSMDALEIIEVWLHVYQMFQRYNVHKFMFQYFNETTKLLCYALHNIYAEYDIDNKEIDEIKDYKRQRTIKRRLKELVCK